MLHKKVLSLLISAMMTIGFGTEMIPQSAIAETTEENNESYQCGNWCYILVNDEARVIEFKTPEDKINIRNGITLPTELDGHKVISFAKGTFDNEKISNEIVIPNDLTAEFDDYWLEDSIVERIATDDFEYWIQRYRGEKRELTVHCWEKKKTVYDNNDTDIEPEITTVALAYVTPSPATTTTAAAAETEEDDTIYDIVIPEKFAGHPIAEIGYDLFADATNLGKVTLPDTISFLSSGMFKNSSVTSLNIPKLVTVIPDNCFTGCKSLNKVIFHDDLFIVSNSAFTDCPYYSDIPSKYKSMYQTASVSQNSWSGTKKVDDWILYFKKYEAPEKPMDIALSSYVGDQHEIVIPKEVGGFKINSIIKNSIFKNSSTSEVSFEEGVTIVPNMSGSKIQKITLPETVTQLSNVFENCPNLTSVTIPANIKYISKTFRECKNLKEIIFEGNEISIDGGTFSGVPIKSIELPGTCTLYPNALPSTCTDISFKAGDKVTIMGMPVEPQLIVVERDGMTSLKSQMADLRSVKFDPDVKEVDIRANTFSKSNIDEIQFPNGKVNIEYGAFKECENLTDVCINGDADIASNAFSQCPNLDRVELSGKCNIGDLAFSECPKLTDVHFDTTQDVSARAFNGCKNLLSINGIEVVPGNTSDIAPELKEYFFKNCHTTHEVGFVDKFTMNRVREIVAEIIDDSMNDMEKIRTIHDWICDNTVYDNEDVNQLGNHVDSSVFMDGVAVCEGYANAYNLLLHEAGIECCYVNTKNHAWNLVKLGDDWFHSDTTWDDGKNITYGWFLCPDSEMSSDSKKGFKITLPSYLHTFQPDELPVCNRIMGDIDKDSEITFSDVSAIYNNIVNGEKYSYISDLTFDGKLSYSDVAAALKLIPDNEHCMGDVNGDGKVDSSDASAVLAEYSRLSTNSEHTFTKEQIIAGDLNSDGRNDSSDASKILGYYTMVSTGGNDDIVSYLTIG